ncbi:MAG: DUF1588 domain-containing protein, partial [Lentisphaeraceae bacterium]|nr:DUF1588 domain-containing protein [Lentisphaeraceae bacterium]
MKKMKSAFLLCFSILPCIGLLGFDSKSQKLFEKYCYDCHSDGVDKGNFEFDKILKKPLTAAETKKYWHKIWDVIEEHQMPPADKKKQPTESEREAMMIGLETYVFSVDREKEYAAPILLSRLSNSQYANSIKQLTGTRLNVSQLLPLDPASGSFSNISTTLNISPMLFERYQAIAQNVAQTMFLEDLKDGSALKRGKAILKESGDGTDNKKVLSTLTKFAAGAYRRPLTSQEQNDLAALYKSFRQIHPHRAAMMESIRSILISPNFLFRTELLRTKKVEHGLILLDDYALASRLSYFLWNSPPDKRLKMLAAKGKLHDNIESEVKRLMKHKNFSYMVKSFGPQWLGIQYLDNNKPSKKIFKGFNTELLRKMLTETVSFLRYTFQNSAPINEIFSSNVTFIDHSLSKFYGVPYVGKKGYAKTEMPKEHNRRGILTQPSVLIVTSDPDRTSPVKRGMWILENLLGMPPPPAPANVGGIEEESEENKNLTFRQQLEKHRSNKACASCHAMMDPLGFAMENFDGVGKWRTTDHGKPLDIKTNWRGDKIDTFDDLYQLLTTKYKDEFVSCFTEKLMTYALGRGLEIEDRISIMKIVKQTTKKESSFQDIFIALVKSTPFQYRT